MYSMKKQYYKYVRVLKNGHRVSSFITTKHEDPDSRLGMNWYKRLTYSTKKVTTAPLDSVGVFIVDSPFIEKGNVAWDSSPVKVELWIVDTVGKVKRVKPKGTQYLVCQGIILTTCIQSTEVQRYEH